MQTLRNITILFAALLISTVAFAQDGTEAGHDVTVDWTDLYIMDIENTGGSNAITMTTDYSSPEADSAISNGDVLATDETTWLNWTVFTPTNNAAQYDIVVSSDVDFNNDWSLRATSTIGTVDQGNATANGAINLSTADQQIINSIPYSSWSGDGANQGANIKYEIVVGNPANITATDQTVVVTYTIAAQ